jgi:hypothetical protein
MQGTATHSEGVADAERGLAQAEQKLDAAIRAFSGLDDVEAARERLTELRDRRDQARDRVAELQAVAAPAVTVGAGDWDLLTIDEQRALIQAVVDEAIVVPGRGCDRITVKTRS